MNGPVHWLSVSVAHVRAHALEIRCLYKSPPLYALQETFSAGTEVGITGIHVHIIMSSIFLTPYSQANSGTTHATIPPSPPPPTLHTPAERNLACDKFDSMT